MRSKNAAPVPTSSDAGAGGASARRFLAALPDFGLAFGFLITWMDPYRFGLVAVPYYLLTMLLEFVTVHSAGFMGMVAFSRAPARHRIRNLFGLGLFYTLFVAGFSLGFSTWWPLIAFWVLTLNRMLGTLLGEAPTGEERSYVQAGWALSVLFYLGGAFATLFLPIPELGLTRGVLDTIELPGSGVWIDEPQRVMAFGVVYFGLSGLAELFGWARSERFLKGVPSETA